LLRLFDPLSDLGRGAARDWWGSGLAFIVN
jgi:hypothetical protein